MLGLMGDTADNIPGCPGVGEKTAQKLIAQFGSIESLLEHTDQLKGAIKTKVETNRKQILFSKFLATIKTDVPISLDMDGLKREEPDKEELKRIFEDLEFRSLLRSPTLCPRRSLWIFCAREYGSSRKFKSHEASRPHLRLSTN